MIQIGILKKMISATYLIEMGFALLILTIGLGFTAIHFNFITAIITFIFAIFIFLVSYQVDKKAKHYLEKIGKQEADLLSIIKEIRKNQEL